MFKGSIPAVITPFIGKRVDYDSLTKVLTHLIDNGSHGLVPCGTTGESPTLSHDEHKKRDSFLAHRFSVFFVRR